VSQLSDIRNAVADRVRASGIDSTVNVFAYPPKDFPLPAVLVMPSGDTYIEYHGTFGAVRVQSVNLLVRIIVPEGGSPQSAGEILDEYLSSGTGEGSSLADAITGNEVTVGSSTAAVIAGVAENWSMGVLERTQTTPVVTCDIPVTVTLKRS
jgi:hypothetical protein